jgi:hypothetical protein
VSDIAVHGDDATANNGVEFHINVDFPNPIFVVVDITVLDPLAHPPVHQSISEKLLHSFALVLVLLASLCMRTLAREKYETIDATAYGTSTQLGRSVGVTVIIYEWSTPEDREILVNAFQKGQNQGLVNALQKMKAVGRIQIPGTLGYDLSFIHLIDSPTGRKIRFVTNRKISFGEAFADSQSQSFDLTAGEFDLNDQDKSQSTGVLYPACQFTINKDGELQIELNQNAWRLSNIIDWKGTEQN